MIQSFMDGVKYLFTGFTIITQPKLRRFVIIPLLVNCLLFSGLMYISGHYFNAILQQFMPSLPGWLQWLSSLLWFLFIFCLLFIMGFSFTAIANIIAAPFNAALSEQVEYYLTNKLPESARTTTAETIKDIPRVLKRQAHIILYYIPRAMLLLLLFIFPLTTLIASPLWFLFSAWSISLQYNDFPYDNHRIDFSTMRQQLSQQRAMTLGFGLCVLSLTVIPFVNFLVMPAAVSGATAMFCEQKRRKD